MTDPGADGVPTTHPAPSTAPGVSAPQPSVPAPPPGPGVAPPFAAPPLEGRTLRVWLGIGVAGLAFLLCCGGGAAALVGLVVAGSQAIDEQSRAVVGDYFGALRDRDYDRAYELLCDPAQGQESPERFRQRVAAEPAISDYRVGKSSTMDEITVPVEVTYTGGARDTLQVILRQDTRSGALEVCGIR